MSESGAALPLAEQFQYGSAAPICLTWDLTYACDLSCVHCLAHSGRRDPQELSTAECMSLIDEFERMRVFSVDIGGGEPTMRPDFWDLADYATVHHVGVKFSTNGIRITPGTARRIAANGYLDVQVSLDGATEQANDAVRGAGAYRAAVRAMELLASAGVYGFELSVAATRHNIDQLDAFQAIAGVFGAQLRLTRLRPSGHGADTLAQLNPTTAQQRKLYDWLCERGEEVLTDDSFFHLSNSGEVLSGPNRCGAGRVVGLVDPVGDVYACPFTVHDRFRAGNVRAAGGFEPIWRNSTLFEQLRRPQAGGACAACSAADSGLGVVAIGGAMASVRS